MPPKKGKEGTKGQKTILNENRGTLAFYFYVTVGASLLYSLCQFFIFWETFTAFYIMVYLAVCGIYLGCYKFMQLMAHPTHDQATGGLLDAGIDLNMKGGMAEHAQDIILLTGGVQMMSLYSNYAWLLWLLAPGRAFYLLWVNILGPWFFADAPEEPVDDKKAKKAERKKRR